MADSSKKDIYETSGDSVKRKKKACPRCGPGVFMAEHEDRVSCGRCGYTEFEKESGKKEQKQEEEKGKKEKAAEKEKEKKKEETKEQKEKSAKEKEEKKEKSE